MRGRVWRRLGWGTGVVSGGDGPVRAAKRGVRHRWPGGRPRATRGTDLTCRPNLLCLFGTPCGYGKLVGWTSDDGASRVTNWRRDRGLGIEDWGLGIEDWGLGIEELGVGSWLSEARRPRGESGRETPAGYALRFLLTILAAVSHASVRSAFGYPQFC